MKKLLLALAFGLSLNVIAQDAIKTSFSTNQIETAVMTWSEAEEKWKFKDNNDLQNYSAFWTFNLGVDGKGGYFTSGDIIYSVFDWEHNDNGVTIDFYSHKLKENGTLIIVVRDNGQNTMSFFLPETNRNIIFYQNQ